MAPTLPRELADAIDATLLNPLPGDDLIQIAMRFGTTYETVRYRRRMLRIRHTIGYDPRKKPGPKTMISPEIANALLEHLGANSDLYAKEIVVWLRENYGINPSTSTVERFLKINKITTKKQKILDGKGRAAETRLEQHGDGFGSCG